MRYVEGSQSATKGSLNLTGDGFIAFSLDGVLRSYSGDGTVIDWRQLDPTQISEWSGYSHPSFDLNVLKRSPETYSDGRLATDVDQLRQPWTEENINSLFPRDVAACPNTATRSLAPRSVPCSCLICITNDNCYFSSLNDDCYACANYGQGGYCMGFD